MEKTEKKKISFISLKLAKKFFIFLIFIIIFDYFLFPAPVLASQNDNLSNINDISEIQQIQEIDPIINNTLPENIELQTKKTGYYKMTAYNSEVAQCDDSPCITATGFNVCEHGIEDTVAANFLKFGTKIRIPDQFGDRVFIVRDRMNSRYDNRVDIWMKDKSSALKFGIKYAKIEILEEP